MPTLRRLCLQYALGATTFALIHTHALAEWKPDRVVTIVVPFMAGGGGDAAARPIATELGRLWGQPVLIDNRPGADTAIGTHKVIDSKPDGYTLLLQVPGVALFKYQASTKDFDALAGLVPVTALSIQPPGFVVNPNVPGKNLKEVLQYCKSAAQPCSVGTLDPLSRTEVKAIAAEAGINNLIFVRYKGTGQMITDVLTNRCNIAIMGLASTMSHYQSGALKVMAIHSKTRASALPEVPTGEQAGFPVFSSEIWYGLFAPKGTPPEVLEGIAAAVREAEKSDAVRKTYASMAAEPYTNTPAEFGAIVRATDQSFSDLVKRFPLDD